MTPCGFSLLFLQLRFSSRAAWRKDASTGAIRGTVLDPSGKSISGATVALVNDATGLHYEQASDQAGRFAFELLAPGEYSARVAADKMSPQISPNIRVEIGGVAEINFSLLMNGLRFTDLALLAPGASQDPRGQNSTSNGDLTFGGIRGFQTSYLVDGGDNNNAFFAQARGRYRAPYQFSNEVVREFRVSPNSVSAESGRAGGAIVNVVTKSGSNKFHATGFYYLRDSSFNARVASLDLKPYARQQQFGFTFGGPVRRNRAFFLCGIRPAHFL